MGSQPESWEIARKNCLGYKKQFQEQLKGQRTYAKLDLDDIFALLSTASRSARGQITELRRMLCRRHWEVTATAHTGGFGNSKGKDDVLHFNILVPGVPPSTTKHHFHIRCKTLPDDTLVVFDVTDGKD